MSPDTGQIHKLAKDEPLPAGSVEVHIGKVFRLTDKVTGEGVDVQVLSFGKGALVVKLLKGKR